MDHKDIPHRKAIIGDRTIVEHYIAGRRIIFVDGVSTPATFDEAVECARVSSFRCPSCHAKGFKRSIFDQQCTFCDGTVGGQILTHPCRGCGKEFEIDYADDLEPWSFDPDTHYCGGSSSCLP